MTAHMNYVFCNIRDGQILAEIPLESVNITGQLGNSGNGELRGSFHLDSTGFDNDTINVATAPGLRFCIAERNGIPVWGGFVWSRTYQSQAKALQFYCKSIEAYPFYRYMPNFVSHATDQLTIFRNLWNLMQGEAGSDLGIVVPTSFPFTQSILLDAAVQSTDYKTYGDMIDDLANGDLGFDWRIDWTRAGNVYTRTLKAAQPTLGSPFGANTLVFDYPGNILNYWETDSLSDAGNNIITLGAGQGESALTSTVYRQDLIDSGYIRLDVSVSSKNTTDQTILDGLAQRQAALHAAPINTIKVQMKADKDPEFGSYALGDTVTLSIEDAWHPEGFTKVTRFVAYTYTPAQAGAVEETELIFEGLQEED